MAVPPAKILLATDLSARSDRALDRTLDLRKLWGAEIAVVHALEFQTWHRDTRSWRQEANRLEAIRRQVRRNYLGEGDDSRTTILIEQGAPEQVVLKAVQDLQTDLLVTGVARDEPFSRMVLGNSASTLVRKAGCPVLVVRKHLRQPYRRIVVATDMSAYSAQALVYVRQSFPDAQVTVFHVAPSYLNEGENYRQQACEQARKDCEAFVSATLGAEAAKAVKVAVDVGEVGWQLDEYVTETDSDLVVVGSHGRSHVLTTLFGTIASNIVESVSCDVLVWRDAA
ncbi:MAG: universal stress protein [Asticcacaulis sp.]